MYERFEELCKKNGVTAYKVSQETGIKTATLSAWKAGKYTPKRDKLQKIADYFGVSVDYLTDGIVPGPRSSDPHIIRVPVLGHVAAGIPVEAITDIIDYEELDPEQYKDGEYYGLKIHGNSMEPRMQEGDVVIVRKQSDIDSGDIAIVRVNGYDATCKKVLKQNNGLLIVGLNPSFSPIFYSQEQIKNLPVEIDGKVVELRAKF